MRWVRRRMRDTADRSAEGGEPVQEVLVLGEQLQRTRVVPTVDAYVRIADDQPRILVIQPHADEGVVTRIAKGVCPAFGKLPSVLCQPRAHLLLAHSVLSSTHSRAFQPTVYPVALPRDPPFRAASAM